MLVWALCFWTLAGCDSYLDVNPKGTLEQEKQFEDVQGYRDAMYGIYATMAKTSLYGEALSWGFVDWLAQLSYDKYMQSEKLVNVKAANQYKYDDPNLERHINVFHTLTTCWRILRRLIWRKIRITR